VGEKVNYLPDIEKNSQTLQSGALPRPVANPQVIAILRNASGAISGELGKRKQKSFHELMRLSYEAQGETPEIAELYARELSCYESKIDLSGSTLRALAEKISTFGVRTSHGIGSYQTVRRRIAAAKGIFPIFIDQNYGACTEPNACVVLIKAGNLIDVESAELFRSRSNMEQEFGSLVTKSSTSKFCGV